MLHLVWLLWGTPRGITSFSRVFSLKNYRNAKEIRLKTVNTREDRLSHKIALGVIKIKRRSFVI